MRRPMVTEVGSNVEVSTVELGPFFGGPGRYETLVFGGVLNGEFSRYAAWAGAIAGHAAMVERVRAAEAGALPDAGVDISS